MNNIFECKHVKKIYKDGLDIINLGSGPSYYDIDFSDKTDKYCSFAMAPQSFEYDLKILNEYNDLLNPNCIVLIVVTSPLSFGRAKKTKKDVIMRGLKYCHFLRKKDVDDISYLMYLLEKYLYFFSFAKKIWNLRKRMSNVTPSKETINEKVQALIQCWLTQAELKNLKDPLQRENQIEDIEKRTNDLKSLIDFCESKCYHTFLVIPPVSEKIREHISDEFLEQFVYKNIRYANRQRIELFDFYNEKEFEDISLYYNGLFLNTEGKEKFSNILWRTIEGSMQKKEI